MQYLVLDTCAVLHLLRGNKAGLEIQEWLFRYTGVKWLTKKIVIDLLGYESCGCEDRKQALNNIQIKRK